MKLRLPEWFLPGFAGEKRTWWHTVLQAAPLVIMGFAAIVAAVSMVHGSISAWSILFVSIADIYILVRLDYCAWIRRKWRQKYWMNRTLQDDWYLNSWLPPNCEDILYSTPQMLLRCWIWNPMGLIKDRKRYFEIVMGLPMKGGKE